ncbi:oligogalacturonate-specific porin KdgM family protein [Vibrio gallicus]|uniref:oligogalacturonate-specific porin KdgM family protein n=1 Tax=Vibrio gallicus TaxID=190897 RepID=UPI0021C46FE4|nr:oligogalacturonate-specific porin KdgM family protein [Vibrio gallicus]
MKTINKITLALLTTVAAASVSAASVDVRQEYKSGQEKYANHIKIGSSVGNHYFNLEAKQQGKPTENWARADNEFEYGYNFKLTDKVTLTPSMPLTFGSDSITYKPQLRIRYKFTNNLSTKLRYRHEFRDYAKTSGKDDQNRSKITGNVDYNISNFQFGFEANYAQDFFNKSWSMGTNGDYEWDYNLKIGYKQSDWAWRPYVEFGNVQDTTHHQRQLRSRVGVKYSF